MSEAEDMRKELAKLKRKATEIASEIHDIVEDTLWSDYKNMLPLSEKLIEACEKYYTYKKENNL